MVSLIGSVIMALGLFFLLVAVVGVIRLPGFDSKVHAAGVADSVGVPAVLGALTLQYGLSIFTLKVLLLMCILWVTSTTTCNILVSYACKGKNKDD